MSLSELDEVLRQLGEIQDELLALPEDAFARRYELRARQEELRRLAAEARSGRDLETGTDDLLAELAALRRRLAEVERLRIDLVSQSGGGGTGGSHAGADAWGAVRINLGIDAAQGRDELVARIGRIKGILIDRGVDPG